MYDIIRNNLLNICLMMYHAFILFFNYESMEYIIDKEFKYREHILLYTSIEENLIYCQIITLFTAACVLMSEDIALILCQNRKLAEETHENIKFIIMVLSYLVKSGYATYQAYHITKELNMAIIQYVDTNPNLSNDLGFRTILVAYVVRLFPFIFTCMACGVGLILFCIGKVVKICMDIIADQLKLCTVTYEQKEYI